MTANAPSARRGENYDRLVRQEELILDVTERLTEALSKTGVTRSELARRLGRTPGFVSQVFSGGRNLTLRTISDIAGALSLRPSLGLAWDRRAVVNIVQWTNWHRPRKPRVVEVPRPGAASAARGPGAAETAA